MERISTQMTAQATINDLASVYEKLATTQQQMSSGLLISQPSDNPYGAGQVVALNGQLAQLNSFSNNINDAAGFVSTTTGALTDISNSVQRVRELVVEASNGTMTASENAGAASEVNQLIDEIKGSANTTYDGQYVFSGTATQTAPYQPGSNDAYQGNSATISRAIGPNVSVGVNADISQLLGSGTSANDGKLLDTLRTIASDLQGGTAANTNALGTTDLQNLDSNISTLTTLQANAGTLTDRLQLASSRIQSTQQSVNSQVSKLQNADFAQTAIQYSTEQAAYTAALKAASTIVQNSLVNFL